MLALYLLTLGISSGLVGVFGHQVLATQGYVPGFHVGVMLAGGVGCAYAVVQLLYMAAIRILKPTRSGTHLLCESLSHAAVLALVPHLLHLRVPWPDPILYKVEPLIYLGAFVVFHVFFKLVSFFAALQGEPSGRGGALGYAAAAGLCALAAYGAVGKWVHELQAAHVSAPNETAYYNVDAESAMARLMPEGAVLDVPIVPAPGRTLTLRWANVPESGEPLERIHATVYLEGNETKRFAKPILLKSTGWTGIRIPAGQIPNDVRQCSISWQASKEPSWRRLTGLRPVMASNRRVLLSGPFLHVSREKAEEPNLVILFVDGLGSNRVAAMGYERDTTPALDRLIYTTFAFPRAYTPAPETAAAAMTLLTGINPLRHGYLGRLRGPLPDGYATLPGLLAQNGYATAAFTEGGAYGDLVPGSGFERGFEIFNSDSPLDNVEAAAEPPDEQQTGSERAQPKAAAQPASKTTLDKAQAWIDEHADIKFAIFIRLGELHDLTKLLRSGAYTDAASESQVYDAALTRLDRCIGALTKHLRDYETRKNTCIALTSPFGYDFGNARPGVNLSEPCLRVPIVLYVPETKKVQRPDAVAMEDLAATLAKLLRVEFPNPIDGVPFLEGPLSKAPVSMELDPSTLTVCNETWRLVWEARFDPQTLQLPSNPGVARLYNLERVKTEGYRDLSVRYSDMTQQWQTQLNRYLQDNAAARVAERK